MDASLYVSFVRVLEHGGFTRAAQALGVPKSTLSRHVADLEKALGVKLIHRTTRKLQLTPNGQMCFQRAQQLLRELDVMQAELVAGSDQLQGLIRLTAPLEIGNEYLPPIIQKFCSLYPKIQFELDCSDRIVDLIGEGFDLALRAGVPQDSALKARKLSDNHMALFAAPAWREKLRKLKHPRDLQEFPLIHFTRPNRLRVWRLVNKKESIDLKVQPLIEVNGISVVRNLLEVGMGIGYLPESSCFQSLSSGKLFPVLSEWKSPVTSFYLIYPDQKLEPKRIKLFIDFLLEHFQIPGI